uniref:CCR4-NOT transcription complex subunit 11 n=1 Tax=Panagrolaimus sp. ES5 TaxID=591445 RepID=A0AC34FF89_9BILA
MTANFLSPQLTSQLTKIINELLQQKEKRLDEISEWFEKRVAGVPRPILLRVLVQYYYFNQFRGPDKISERIILHFCVFSVSEFRKTFDNYNFTRRDQEINPSVAVLLKCYSDEYRRYDTNFASITCAEKQFIGRLLGYTYEQRRLLLFDETPEKLAKVRDDDPFNCYVASLLKRGTTATYVRDVFMGLKTTIPNGFNTSLQPSSPSLEHRIQQQQPIVINIANMPSSSFSSSRINERSEPSCSSAILSPSPNVRSESQQAIIETAQTILADFDNNVEPHFSTRTDSGVHDCEAINAESALDELFNGSIKSLRHDELESLKNFFEKDTNYGILKSYNITLERIIECVIAFPKMMGSALAFMLAANDEKVYTYLNHMIHESFSAATMVAMVQMFVESFKRELRLDPKFVDNTLTCCLDFLDSESAIKVTKSDDARIVRLVIYYIHIVVIYMPDVVSHRFGEIMNVIPNYSHIRTAPVTYNKILQHQRKYGSIPSSSKN